MPWPQWWGHFTGNRGKWVRIWNPAQSPTAACNFSQRYFTGKVNSLQKILKIETRAPCSLGREGPNPLFHEQPQEAVWGTRGITFCHDHQKENQHCSVGLGNLGHSIFTDFKKWNPFFPFGFSHMDARGAVQLRHTGRESKTAGRYLEGGGPWKSTHCAA